MTSRMAEGEGKERAVVEGLWYAEEHTAAYEIMVRFLYLLDVCDIL